MWLLLLLLAHAGPAELAGVWTLDRAASDPVDPLLEARGYSWVLRQAAAYSQVTQTFSFEGDRLHIHVKSTLRETDEDLFVNGARQTRTTDQGEPVEYWTRWQGEVLVTNSVITGPDGQRSYFDVSRRVEAGGAVMRQTMTWRPPQGEAITVDRIFRRA